nr:MAG: glycoprotein [Rhabdoviridae sp.]
MARHRPLPLILTLQIFLSNGLKETWVGYLTDPLTPGEIKLEHPPLGAHHKISTSDMITEGLVNSTHFLVQFPSISRWFFLPRVLAPPPLPSHLTVIHSHARIKTHKENLTLMRGNGSLFLPVTKSLRFFSFHPSLMSTPHLVPPMSCQLDDSSSLLSGILRVWGPPSHASSMSGSLVTCKTKSENCTKYFFGSEQVVLNWDKPTHCNSFHHSLMLHNKKKLEIEPTLTLPVVQAPCLWTGTQLVSEDYIESLRVNVILSADGYISFPPGFSSCKAFQNSTCVSASQVLFLDKTIEDPSDCKNLEIKLISKSFIQAEKSENKTLHLIGVKDPHHQLGFSLEDSKAVCLKEGTRFSHRLLLTKSSYIISIFLIPDGSSPMNVSSPDSFSRDLPDDLVYWKEKESHDQHNSDSHFSVAVHQWKLHHKLPIRTQYSESEMIYGLSDLMDKTNVALKTLFLELCRVSTQIWKLAFQSWTLNPTLMAQVLTGDPTVIGENRAGKLRVHHSVPAGPLKLSKPILCRGDWMSVHMFNMTDQTYTPVWIQKFSGFVVPIVPKVPVSPLPPNFFVPFNKSHYLDVLNGIFLTSALNPNISLNKTFPFFSSDLTLERSDINSLEYVSKILDEITIPVPDDHQSKSKERDRGVDISHHWKDFVDWITSFFLSWKIIFVVVILLMSLCLIRVCMKTSKCFRDKHVSSPPESPLSSPWFSSRGQAGLI